MGSRLFLIAALLGGLLTTGRTVAQEYALKHLTTADGLPSNWVYNMFQDRMGYLWFCTDHGVAQYNGNSFQLYTTSTGLPDNEVFALTEDHAGRIWLVTYTHEPCFIQNEKVFDASNNSLCRELAAKGVRYSTVFRRNDGTTILAGERIAVISGDSARLIYCDQIPAIRVQNYYATPASELFVCADGVYTPVGNRLAKIYTASLLSGYLYDNRLFLFGKTGELSTIHELDLAGLRIVRKTVRSFPLFVFGFGSDADGRMLMMTTGGLYEQQATSGFRRIRTLPAEIISNRVLVDRDSNTWFSTTDKGIYVKPRACPRHYEVQKPPRSNNTTFVRRKADGSLIAGTDGGRVTIIRDDNRQTIAVPGSHRVNRVRFAEYLPANRMLVGCDLGLYAIDIHGRATCYMTDAQKAIYRATSGRFLIASASRATAFDTRSGRITTLVHHRTTAVAEDSSGRRYFGTLEGLFMGGDSSGKVLFGEARSRITSLSVSPDQQLIAGTHNDGVYIRNGLHITHLSSAEGLSSDNCRKVLADADNHIWVCSDKGLDEIFTESPGKQAIRHHAPEKGLSMASINDFDVDSRHIYLATTDGISVLDRTTSPRPPPPIYIRWVKSRDSTYRDVAGISLPHTRNDLQIAYSGVFFQNGAPLQYRYVLRGTGLDTIVTSQGIVNFPAVAPGEYEFLVWAGIAGAGTWSRIPARLSIRIAQPFWRTSGFLFIAVLAGICLLVLLYRVQIARIRKKEQEKSARLRQMGQLKLEALRAQINPHFIFNALNSIQHYYSENDERSANRYLTLFAKLVRATLINSKRDWLTLSEEISILTSYIELECMRFRNAFDFEIDLADNINPESTWLPTMLIQPYVENAITHGLRNLTDRRGTLRISFSADATAVHCLIIDDGIGRQAAADLKPKQHRSVGMELNQERIANINDVYQTDISLSVLDGSGGNRRGTQINIIIPKTKIPADVENDHC